MSIIILLVLVGYGTDTYLNQPDKLRYNMALNLKNNKKLFLLNLVSTPECPLN